MRNTFISSLVADAKFRDRATDAGRNLHRSRIATKRWNLAGKITMRNILAAMFGAMVGLLVIWTAKTGASPHDFGTPRTSVSDVLLS